MNAAHFLAPALSGGGRLVVEGRTVRLADRLEFALDSGGRRRGLLGRDGLSDGDAFVIAPSSAVHTFFMRFPIDLVFATRDGRVLKVRAAVPPWRISAAAGAFAVIELRAGACERTGVRPGDRLRIEPVT